ncbi:MAG: cytidylate kinase-like family protein [Planctomycetes bacterium]|nr:cytidylate kinase-like family protein [Planctomycetota bacterium]
MSGHPSRSHGSLADAAERQMKAWAMSLEVRERVDKERALQEVPRRTHPYVSISRQCGAGGTEIAQYLARHLGWEVLDREILQYMSQQYRLPETILEHVDESRFNWLWDIFGTWLDRKLVTQTEYVSRLGRILMLAARHGPLIIVGRGSQFILPRERGVLVRVIAPEQDRVRRVMRRQGMSREEATQYIATQDRDRDEFVRRYFHRDASDPQHYDLVINTQFTSPADAAELITLLCRSRFGDELKS